MPGNSSYRIWRASWIVFAAWVTLILVCAGAAAAVWLVTN